MTQNQKPIVVTIVFMGDSITAGQYVDHDRRWTSLISDRLDAATADTQVHAVVANRGISGETTRQGLLRFANDVQAIQPDILTLQFGMNDANCWLTDRGLPRVSEGAFRANLHEMVVRARHFGTRHIALVTNHCSLRRKVLLNGRTFEQCNERYSEIIREVAADEEVTLCDVRAVFEQFSQAELENLLLSGPDHIHLSDEGHRVYADAVWEFVDTAVKAIPRSKQARKAAA